MERQNDASSQAKPRTTPEIGVRHAPHRGGKAEWTMAMNHV
jgi:hypothetical protein